MAGLSQLAGVSRLPRLGLGLTRPTGGGGAPRLRVVATRMGTEPRTAGTNITNAVQLDGRMLLQSPKVAVKNAQVLFSGQLVDEPPAGEANGPAAFVAEAAFEIAGVNTRVTKDGLNAVPVGLSDFAVFSDKAGITIPALTSYYLRYSQRVASLGTPMARPFNVGSGYQNPVYYSTQAGNQVSGTGALTPYTSASTGWHPMTIIGEPQGSMTAVAIMMTSIEGGTGETTPNAQGSYGYIPRGLDGVSINIPRITLARASSQLVDLLALGAGRLSLLQYVDAVVIGSPTNDFFAGNRSLAAVKADFLTLLPLAKAQGRQVAVNAMFPRSTSTDGWTTAANQTPRINGFAGGATGSDDNRRNDWNLYLETLVADGTIAALGDINVGRYKLAGGSWVTVPGGGIEDQSNLGKWRTDAGALTDDGVHPNTAGHTSAGLTITAMVAALGW